MRLRSTADNTQGLHTLFGCTHHKHITLCGLPHNPSPIPLPFLPVFCVEYRGQISDAQRVCVQRGEQEVYIDRRCLLALAVNIVYLSVCVCVCVFGSVNFFAKCICIYEVAMSRTLWGRICCALSFRVGDLGGGASN